MVAINKEGRCAPYALSMITNQPTDYWFDKLISIGARDPEKSGTRLTTKHLYDLGFIPVLYNVNCTVREFPNRMHSAKWLCFVDHHVVAIIDKEIFETSFSLDKQVKRAWMYIKKSNL